MEFSQRVNYIMSKKIFLFYIYVIFENIRIILRIIIEGLCHFTEQSE